ncbi:O-antigen ligase [Leptospira yanagawae serovar Saopaulo str. Sao Paulo = ATCC 700523]|uniref:O-antigen ligase n=1 Tax=Leptospira yanagawae serovar Saopaulo str. Sao Paulo = ATCC 700523 TaxID=1249483 RepID=A0A5E8HB37_9LEPT|nr:O-antigen ligase family protein [Leptospira yanagawae]EOQ88062.1 O-antigen ligase [Leptospira yanagawae serovar Saopaulo str. Sao Paulo = ATCC 700523]
MKQRLIYFFDFFYVYFFFLLFLGETNQKFFRNDAIGFALLFVIIYLFVYLRKGKKKLNYESILHLILTVLLCNFTFFKIAEYDPIQLLPEKLVIKLTMVFWNGVIFYQHYRNSGKDFYLLGSLLAIIPCFVSNNFTMYPIVPIGFAIWLMIRYSNFETLKITNLISIFICFALFWIVRDWADDFALVRIFLLLEVFFIILLIRGEGKEFRQTLINHALLIFLINSTILIIKMLVDKEFKISSFHEDIFLIPVSLIGSNTYLILGLTSISFSNVSNEKKLVLFYFFVLLVAIFFLLTSYSRISIASSILLVLFFLWFKNKLQINLRMSFLFISLIVVSFVVLAFSEKSFFNIETVGIRYSIWKLHFLNTVFNQPILGFGFNSERLLPFVDDLQILPLDFYLVKDYINHFNTYPLAHNLYFQIISSIGLIGFGLFVISLIYLFKKSLTYKSTLRSKNSIPFAVLVIWLIHEVLDFSSLEIGNVFILGLVIVELNGRKINTTIEKLNLMFGTLIRVITFMFLFIYLVLSLRFSKTEQMIFKYHKDIKLTTFTEFNRVNQYLNANHLGNDLKQLNDFEILLLGNRYFYLNLNLAKYSYYESIYLNQCFQHISRKELCYANLLSYIERLDDKNKEKYKSAIQILLASTDPFGIYSKDFL